MYYRHAVDGCYCNIHTPKTRNGIRQVPMLTFVRDALLEEQRRQLNNQLRCVTSIDGYTDFIFIKSDIKRFYNTLAPFIRGVLLLCRNHPLTASTVFETNHRLIP